MLFYIFSSPPEFSFSPRNGVNNGKRSYHLYQKRQHFIRTVKKTIDIPLIVGGGIRTKNQAIVAASAGADIIVTGNIIESTDAKRKVSENIDGVKGNGIWSPCPFWVESAEAAFLPWVFFDIYVRKSK